MLIIFNQSFHTFEMRKLFESLCSPYGVVSKKLFGVFHAFLMQFT